MAKDYLSEFLLTFSLGFFNFPPKRFMKKRERETEWGMGKTANIVLGIALSELRWNKFLACDETNQSQEH